LKRNSKIAIIAGIIAVVIIATALAVHFRLSETERSEIESGAEQNENESPTQLANEIVSSIQNNPNTEQNENLGKPEGSEQNESNEQSTTSLPSYIKIVDGVQVVTVNAQEFKFTPSEIHIHAGLAKFVMVNDGVGAHELVVYEASKKEIVDKAEMAEDEETIQKNILFEIDETPAGETAESEVMNLNAGPYVIGCHMAGHYEAGMKGTLIIE
jgi:uncharacterized cupredoxin-like copper-binding protein